MRVVEALIASFRRYAELNLLKVDGTHVAYDLEDVNPTSHHFVIADADDGCLHELEQRLAQRIDHTPEHGPVVFLVPVQGRAIDRDWRFLAPYPRLVASARAIVLPGDGEAGPGLALNKAQGLAWAGCHALVEMTLYPDEPIFDCIDLRASYLVAGRRLYINALHGFLTHPGQARSPAQRSYWSRAAIGHYWFAAPDLDSPITDGFVAHMAGPRTPSWHMRDFCLALGMPVNTDERLLTSTLSEAKRQGISLMTGPAYLDDQPKEGFGVVLTSARHERVRSSAPAAEADAFVALDIDELL